MPRLCGLYLPTSLYLPTYLPTCLYLLYLSTHLSVLLVYPLNLPIFICLPILSIYIIYLPIYLLIVVQLSDFLWPHGLQNTRLPCPSLSPRVCSNSYLLSWWCHPTISSSVTPFSSCPQSSPASGSFSMSQLFGQTIGASASASVLPTYLIYPHNYLFTHLPTYFLCLSI